MWWPNKILKRLLTFVAILIVQQCVAQELFIISEPASNMPAKALSFRITNKFMNGHRHSISGKNDDIMMHRIVPEVGIGLNKKFNVRLSTFIANYYQSAMQLEGFNAYLKYRFYSKDDLHKHFRMAAFSRVAVIDHPIYFREVNLEGDNSGINTGLVATQLLHKLALSLTAGHVLVLDNIGFQKPEFVAVHGLNYTLSAGYLLLPFHYKNYNQPNLNVYLELHGRNSLSEYNTNIYDVFPALQLILKSYMRIDLGYRYQIKGNATRNAYTGFLVRFEYNIFNAIKN
jgi:hypothetical protein